MLGMRRESCTLGVGRRPSWGARSNAKEALARPKPWFEELEGVEELRETCLRLLWSGVRSEGSGKGEYLPETEIQYRSDSHLMLYMVRKNSS
jgi:hypothetical protein